MVLQCDLPGRQFVGVRLPVTHDLRLPGTRLLCGLTQGIRLEGAGVLSDSTGKDFWCWVISDLRNLWRLHGRLPGVGTKLKRTADLRWGGGGSLVGRGLLGASAPRIEHLPGS